jgi:hypothetical protein
MAFQVSPGINISEQDLTTVVPNVATAIGAYAGGFAWGPVDERTTVTTENELVDIFGKPNASTYIDFWTCANYLAYSNNLIVVRVTETAATNATVGDDDAGAPIDIRNATHYDASAGTLNSGTNLFVAKYPGILGNSLDVRVIDSNAWSDSTAGLYSATGTTAPLNEIWQANFDGAPGTSADVANAGGSEDEIHVIVIDSKGWWTGTPGYILEKFAYVSKASDAKRHDGSSNYVKDVLRNESKYAWIGDVTEMTANSSGTIVPAGTAKAGTTFSTFDSTNVAKSVLGGVLAGGDDGYTSSTRSTAWGTRALGYGMFATAEVVDVNLILGGDTGASPSAGNTYLSGLVGQGATERNDAMVFLSPSEADAVTTPSRTEIITDKNVVNNYVVFDGAWKYQYDRYRDMFMYVPMNGDTAGLCARTEHTDDAWWSPAGMSRGQVKNIVKLSWEPNRADRDALYQASVNPYITMAGAGVILWGDKTAQITPTAFDRINVRRLFIVLEKAISTAAKAMLFEFNDEFTRSSFVNMVEPFLREVQGRRGITDFKVVCDGSNNPGNIIDTNQFVGDIYVKPARSINYIQLNFIAARTDVSFSEIGG